MGSHAWVSEEGCDKLGYFKPTRSAHRQLELNNEEGITQGTNFRGFLNDNIGPYLLQFLPSRCNTLGMGFSIDDPGSYLSGNIRFDPHRIDNRVRKAVPNPYYMTISYEYTDVANGVHVRGRDSYVPDEGDNDIEEEMDRFIHTPRDIATYDALYQQYFNACLLMLSMGIGYDAGLLFADEDEVDKQIGGFPLL